MHRGKKFVRILLISLIVLGWIAAVAPVPVVAAPSVQITVSLYRVVELSCNEGDFEACGNDYYPKFKIGDEALFDGKDDFCCAHGADFRTNWVHQVTVDAARNPISIHLELWDQDDHSGDDVIHWARNGDYLDLAFDLNTCVFTGGGLTTEQDANLPTLAGESQTGGADSARGYFTISTPACVNLVNTVDSDGDGINNRWEMPGQGLDVNNDGTVDVPFGDAPFSAVPYRKDLFVEADFMTGDRPQDGALTDVVNAFAAAPVDPYTEGSTPVTRYRGVTLHTTPGDEVPNIAGLLFKTNGPGDQDDFNDLKIGKGGPCRGFFGTAADRASPNCVNILEAKRQVYRYMIFGESFAENLGSSGTSEYGSTAPKGGNDFIVTLGSWSDSGIADAGGRRAAEAATFMHELGHTLGLGHGGFDDENCKPNYLSIMNYTLQFNEFDSARPLDYASTVRGTALTNPLDEAHLNETNGVRGTPNPARNTVYGVAGKPRTEPATAAAIDWNGINGNTETDVAADIDTIESIRGCDTASPGATLQGFDDWANLQYNPRLNLTYFADGRERPGTPDELTETDVRKMAQKADLKITKTADRAEVTGGDTIGYTVTVTDLGPGTATGIAVTDTMPDGTTQPRALADLTAGATHTVTPAFAYTVPCATPDGTTLTNAVTVTGADTNGIADPYTSDNTARATTVVRAPVLTLHTTATPTVDAGAAITYTVTYANTGSGATANATITATVPTGLYYSTALDLGAGPRPASMTANPDGTRTLSWNVGAVPARSGERTITFTARPSLLAANGTTYTTVVTARYANASTACTFAPVTAPATSTIAVPASTRDAQGMPWWMLHPAEWTPERLARVQATDQRYDTDQDGALSTAEITATYRDISTPLRSLLGNQLLTTYLNLAAKRINAQTAIRSPLATLIGVYTVGAAATFATDTLAMPVNANTTLRYANITVVLDSINNNIIETY